MVEEFEERLDGIERKDLDLNFTVSELSDVLRGSGESDYRGRPPFGSKREEYTIGNVVHEVLSERDVGNLGEAVERSLVEEGVLDPSKREDLKKQIVEALEEVYEDEFFQKLETGEPDFREMPVFYAIDGVSCRGVLDRLVYLEEEDEWYLVDYKSDRGIE